MALRALPARINLVTLGVADVAAATAFYERLGFKASGFESESVTFFDMNGTILGLYGRAALAEDAGVESDHAGAAFKGVTLAINLASKTEVDAALAFAETCGGRIVQPAREVFWGGYSGYFADPDNHLWEIAFNPITQLRADGQLELPPPRA